MSLRLAATVAATGLAVAGTITAGPALAAGSFAINVDPTSAKPGASLHITGTAPASCADTAYTVTQQYTNGDSAQPGDKSVTSSPVTATGTSIDTTVTVPADAVRSDAAENNPVLPDTVTVSFASCTDGAQKSDQVDITVLPVSTNQTITLTPASPRSGSVVTISVTGCVGNVVDTFIEDSSEHDFDISGGSTGDRFDGTATLTGAVAGDAVAYVACAQSERPSADAIFESRSAVDFTILPAATPVPTPSPTQSAAPVAKPATAVRQSPHYTG